MTGGVGLFCSDEPLHGNPRVLEAGKEYYERNSKLSSDWFAHGKPYVETKPDCRLRTDDARDIALKNRGTMQFNMEEESSHGNARILEVGKEYYKHNTKESSDWFTQDKSYFEVKPELRLRTDDARCNAFKNRGSMQDNLQGYAEPPVVRTIHPRGVRPEAQVIAERNKGRDTWNLIDHYGHLDMSPRPVARVKGSDAEEYKERERGSTKLLLDHFAPVPIPAHELPPPHRLRLGAEQIAEKHKGEGMKPIMKLEGSKTPREPRISRLHQESTGSGWDELPPHYRMRPEGEIIAQKCGADSMGDVMVHDTSNIPHKKIPKILKHMTESQTPRKAAPHRVRLDGVQNLERALSHTDMSAIMHGSLYTSPAQTGGKKKILPHQQKSQLW